MLLCHIEQCKLFNAKSSLYMYEVHTISFQTFFVWALLLIIHTWVSSLLQSNLLQLQCTCCTFPKTSERPHANPLVWPCQWPSSQPLSPPQLSHNESREQGLDYREDDELSWCPSWSNSLWQEWICVLLYCPGGNAPSPIWRVLVSSDGISSWTPLKPQHNNPNPNTLANQLWFIDFLTPPTPLINPHRLPAFFASLMPLKNWCSLHARWSKRCLKHSIRFCSIFPSLKQNFIAYSSSEVLDCILKFTSCNNQVLAGCIPIPAVAIHLNVKS